MTERNKVSDAQLEILIVEDSPMEAELLCRTLVNAGYAVRVVHNGEEGLQAVRARRPALVMSDINMPVMNGYQLCRAIKNDYDLWNIPVILLTVLTEPEHIIEAINSGADAYIIKPYAELILLDRIRALLYAPIERPRTEERRKEVVGYGGKRHPIAGGGQQILNLLLSLYENTLTQNRDLVSTQAQLNLLTESLKQQVLERTEELSRVNRVQRVLAVGNHVLVRTTSEEELLQSSVRNVVENGGYALAGISYAMNDPDKILRRVALAGAKEDFYPPETNLTWSDTSDAQLPVVRSVRSGTVQICHDIASDPVFSPWKDIALARGYASNIALPLIDDGKVFGCLCIFSSEANIFAQEEATLLEELAGDIAYGIVGLRNRAALQATEQALRNSEEIYRKIATTARDAIISIEGEKGVVTAWNHAAEVMFGYSEKETIGRAMHEMIVPIRFREAASKVLMHFAATGKGEAIDKTLELLALHKDGQEFPIELSLTAAKIHGSWHAIGIVRDITERKIVENELLASERRYRRLFESAKDGILILEFETGRVVDANPFLLDLLGYSRDDLLGKRIWELGFFKNVAANRDKFQQLQQQEYVRYEDLPLEAVQGQVKHVEFISNVYLVNDAKVIQCNIRDITDRKQAAEALRKAKDLLQFVIENVPVHIFWKDRASRYLGCNSRFAKDAGYANPDELIGKTDFEMAWKDQAELYRADDKAVVESGVPKLDFDVPHTTPNGDTLWIRTSKVPLYDASNQIIGLLGIYQDITERKAAEEQVRKLSLAVEQSPESIVITDLDANIEYVNEAFVRKTGYSREEVIGRNPRILQSGKTPRATFDAMWQALNDGQIFQCEMINRRKDGSEYLESAVITPIRQPDGRISHYLAVKEDITEQKRNDEELDRYRYHLEELVASRTRELNEAKRVAEAANAAKSAFVANMSHEIRTPLNAIVGLTHLLRRGKVDPAHKEKLNKIVDASHHLLSVINDILDFSKIEVGKLGLSVVDFVLDRMLDNVVSMIGPSIREKRLELVVDRDDLPAVLVGDSTRLAQALLNYLSNAVKFTEHGTISLRLSKTEETANDLLLRFEVTDTGIGIAPDKIAGLFAAFQQIDANISRRYGGTGLGLAITKRLADLMGGDAGAQSMPGHGSTFWFTARLGKSQRRQEELALPPAVAAQNLKAIPASARILLAEDNKINQEVAVELLTEIGLTVEIANDGYEALEKARGGGIDLILMDMQMPGMDGIEATHAIRALPDCATLPIVAMTANAFVEDRERCKAVGMNDFVAKPVDPDQLYATLLRWLPAAVIVPDTVTASSEGLPAELTAIPGLDAEIGLKVLNGHLAAYLRLLRRYVNDHAEDMTRLRERMVQGDRDQTRLLAHTLKGSSGNLGISRVQHMAAELEAAIQDDCDQTSLERLIGTLENELQSVTTAIIAALPEEKPTLFEGEVDWSTVRQMLDELEPFLAASNTRANRLVENHAALLKATLGPLGMELERQIENFEYPEAFATLQQVREKYPELATKYEE